MSELDLQEKFPELRPIKSPPSLFTVNGCGLTVAGRRDVDEETGTYVKTHCLCLVFIPVLAVGAYRVADAAQGWYFLGKVPLSPFARAWNTALLLFVLGFGGWSYWQAHTSSPNYLAGRKIAEADALVQAGQIGPAAQQYLEVALGPTTQAASAGDKLQQLVSDAANQPAAEAAVVFKAAAKLHARKPALIANAFEQGWAAAQKQAGTDPLGALAIVDAIAPLAKDHGELKQYRQQLLEQELARDPGNREAAVKLAGIYEDLNKLELCEKLLTPHRDQLGSSEGARILGQIMAHKDQFDLAYPLLLAYAEPRLKQLQTAERKYEQALKAARDRITKELDSGKASGFDYNKYKSSPDAVQQTMVGDYFDKKYKAEEALQDAQEEIAEVSGVVPVTLDLGIVLLRRGQALADPAQRKAELERAEKTFLSVRGQAGETDQYRAFLGQVYYWLAKHDQGKKLFDDLLASKGRNAGILAVVSRMLREVGANSEARALVEEAYNLETDRNKKYDLAHQRALIWVDHDDQIAWLRQADPTDNHIKASLAAALGEKALRDGQEQEAALQLREAIAIYGRLPDSAGTFNNAALAYITLYHVSGDPADLLKAGELLDKAIALQPSNSILLRNAAFAILEAAARDLIGPAIDLKALKLEADVGLLTYLYNDRAGRDQLLERARKHPGLAKAISFFDRLTVLAPKDVTGYAVLANLHELNRNAAGLRGVQQRLQEAQLDLADYRQRIKDYQAGKEDDKMRQQLTTSIDKNRATLAGLRQAGTKGVTLSVAAVTLAGQLMRCDDLKLPLNADEVVGLAEEARTVAPARATSSLLRTALLFRADLALAKQSPEYQALVDLTRRSLDPNYRLALALELPDSVRALLLANPDFQRAVALLNEDLVRYDEPTPWTWVILRAVHPDQAGPLAKTVATDEVGQLDRAIDSLTAPLGTSNAYRECWYQQLIGNPAQGMEILKSRAAQGVPVWLPK